MEKQLRRDISVKYIKVNELNPAVYNPRKYDKKSADQLKESITKFGLVDPIIVNEAPERKNIVDIFDS